MVGSPFLYIDEGENVLQDIMLYIYKKYGLQLSRDEIEEFLNWYNVNKEILLTEEEIDRATRRYLYDKYKGRPIHLHEEDLSNMKYLLTLLKEKTKGKKNE